MLPSHARTVDALLQTKGTNLTEFILARRNQGYSHQRIARELLEFTDRVVDLTGETVRQWAAALEDETIAQEAS